MKRVLCFVLALSCLQLHAQYMESPYSSLTDGDVVSNMKQHVGFLSSSGMEGRKAGSDSERSAAEYVAETFLKYGVDVISPREGDLFGIRQETGDTLTSRNVTAFIPGYDKTLRNNYIVIGARLDNLGTAMVNMNGEKREKVFYGANGNASGLAVLLELARMLQTNKVLLKRSVILAAFGSSLEQQAGSWYFLNRSFAAPDRIDAMINLDMLGTISGGFYAFTASNQDINDCLNALQETLQPVQPVIVSNEPVASDHRSFYNREIPSVFFTTGMYPEYNTDRDTASILEYDGMERELEYIYNFTLNLCNGEKPSFRRSDPRGGLFPDKDVVPFYECDRKPSFLGSSDPIDFLKRWVYVYLRYPSRAVSEGIQGKVLVDFVINEKGKVTDVTVQKGVDPLLDDEAVRVIKASPDWKPAMVDGKKVKCAMSLYVEFRLKRNR